MRRNGPLGSRALTFMCRFHKLLTMGPTILALALASGCDNQNANSEATKEAQAKAELAKFETPELAQAEIERRLGLYLTRNGCTLTVKTDAHISSIYVVPVSIPWVVSCDRFGFSVQFGSGFSDNDSISIDIIPAKLASQLTEDKCSLLAPIAGEQMMVLTYVPS